MSNTSKNIRDPFPPPWPDVDPRSWNSNPVTKSPIDDIENEKMVKTQQKDFGAEVLLKIWSKLRI